MNSKKILYIAGAGRSGSTLFDIVLGNLGNSVSVGELSFLVENGIEKDEFCSCGQRVSKCIFWIGVVEEWKRHKTMTTTEYLGFQKKYLRNKQTVSLVFDVFFHPKRIDSFIKDSENLYGAIFEKSIDSNYIIDSSKNTHYILLLRKMGVSFRVLHLTRSFSGVLNSTVKQIEINPKLGVERELKGQTFTYTLGIWFLDNFLAYLFSIGINYQRVQYEKLIEDPLNAIQEIMYLTDSDKELLNNRGDFYAKHLVAGGRTRMKGSLVIKKQIEKLELNEFSWFQQQLIKFTDFIYFKILW